MRTCLSLCECKHAMLIAVFWGSLLLMACQGDERVETLLTKQNQLEKIVHANAAIHSDPLVVDIEQFKFSIKDEMFEPKMLGEVTIRAKHDALPHNAYLQLQVNVSFKTNNRLQLDEKVWVDLIEGEGLSLFSIELPQHELKDADAIVSFTPIAWFPAYPATLSMEVGEEDAKNHGVSSPSIVLNSNSP